MSFRQRIRDYAQQDRSRDATRLRRFAHYEVQVWYIVLRRLWRGPTLTMSSALSFRTIFAIVPLLVLALLMVRSIADVNGEKVISNLLQQAGLSRIEIQREIERLEAATRAATQPTTDAAPDEPALGGDDLEMQREMINLANRLEHLVNNVAQKLTLGKVGPFGALVFIWTALTLLITMEGSLNTIFETSNSRPWGTRILLYWAVVTLAPVLIVPAEYAGSLLAARAQELAGTGWLVASLAWLARLLAGALVLAAVYKWLPFTRVRFWNALRGAIVASVLWNIAKWGFGLYLTRVVPGNVYGALGVLPLFLFWVNLSWMVFVFGATFVHTTDNLRNIHWAQQAQELYVTPSSLLATALSVARRWQTGHGPVRLEQIEADLDLPRPFICRMLDTLERAGVLCPVGPHQQPPADAYALAKPAERIPVLNVMQLASAADDAALDERYRSAIGRGVRQVRELAGERMGELTLAGLAETGGQ